MPRKTDLPVKDDTPTSLTKPLTSLPPASVAFIHNYLDEYSLDPYEFRLYAHVVRRTGGKPEGVCFASLKKIAQTCKMSTRKAQQAMQVLIKANLVSQNKRGGRTDEYRVKPASEWAPRQQLDEIREEVRSKKEKTELPDDDF